jgi:hypothetical protein
MEDLVSKPILFNYWKHHMNFLLSDLQEQSVKNDISSLRLRMQKIGNSTTDLYTGKMNIPELVNYCIDALKKMHRYRKDIYLNWLREKAEEYKFMDFPDGSVWILKIGTEEGRYIHLHPGRNVPGTLRVKATILKTSYLVNLHALIENISPLDINLINTVRNDILGLSPIKFVTMNHDLGKMIYLFGSKLGILK